MLNNETILDIDLEHFIEELIELVNLHIVSNNDGYSSIGDKYWFGRLCESEETKKDIRKLLLRHMVG